MNRHFSCLNIRISVEFFVLLVISIILMPKVVTAKVVKVEINSREVVPTSPEHIRSGPYEEIKGILYLEVDPNDPANQLIVDLKLAEPNNRGLVEFSTEFVMDFSSLPFFYSLFYIRFKIVKFLTSSSKWIGSINTNQPFS